MTTATTDPVCGPIEISFTHLNSNFRKHAYRNIKEIKEKKHRILCKVIKVMGSFASSPRAKVDLEW
jgi:hypothetical protein